MVNLAAVRDLVRQDAEAHSKAKAAERGETATDVILRAVERYTKSSKP